MKIFSRRAIVKIIAIIIPSVLLAKFLKPTLSDVADLIIPISVLPVNGMYIIKDKKVGIINQSGDIKCISIECTHLGCTLNVVGEELVCPCHGSVFTLNGDVLRGPANKPLKLVPFSIKNKSIIINKLV